MTQTVHQPRVAWDGARAFVQAAGSPHSEQFAARGDRYAADVESGKWRVRLEDLLRRKPELTEAVLELTGEAFEL